MSSLPLMDLEVAASVGSRGPSGPRLGPGEISDVVAGLRDALAASVEPVCEVAQLSAPTGGRVLVIDRPAWVQVNTRMVATMLTEATGEPLRSPDDLLQEVGARLNGVQLGAVFGMLGARILGQYLPFLTEPLLVVVAPNVAKVERELRVNHADFRLWVCLHEQAHRLQFASAPWLRGHLTGLMGELLRDVPADPDAAAAAGSRRPGRPSSLVDVLASPAQRVYFDEVAAVMSLLEGHADVMMDRVGPAVVPTVATIRRAFDKRRGRGGWTAVVNKALGMDLKLAQYREGAAFCRAAIDAVGVEGLNAVFVGPENLPRPGEIADPGRWVRRVHG